MYIWCRELAVAARREGERKGEIFRLFSRIGYDVVGVADGGDRRWREKSGVFR